MSVGPIAWEGVVNDTKYRIVGDWRLAFVEKEIAHNAWTATIDDLEAGSVFECAFFDLLKEQAKL